MASYLRESERFDTGLPTIHSRPGLIDGPRREFAVPPPLDPTLERHVRFVSTAPAGIYDPPSSSRVYHPRPPSPTRKHVMELQDQVNMFKDEMSKKDRLISQLTSLETKPVFRGIDSNRIEELYSTDRIAAAAASRSEVSSLQVKVEGLHSQLRDAQAQLDVRESKIRELNLSLETARENESKQVALVHSLREQLVQVQAATGNLESAASRGSVAIETLQNENRQLQDRILELESRVRIHLEERERAEQKFEMADKKYTDLVNLFISIFRTDAAEVMVLEHYTPEIISARLTEIVQENAMLKGKLLTMKEYVANADMENKASRETIMRLVSESEREQKITTRWNLELEALRVERDSAVAKERDLEKEIALLKERVETSNRALHATREELSRNEERTIHFDRISKETTMSAKNYENQMKSFKEQLASILSDSYIRVEPFEEAIRERIRQILTGHSDTSAHTHLLEEKVASLTSQLERNQDLYHQADRSAKRAVADMAELKERLHRAEGELSTSGVYRDGLRTDKEHFLRFMERLALAMRMDKVSADIGYDLTFEALIARAEQLAARQSDEIVDRTTHIHNLQRKLKSFKDQLESKDLHMDLLRKKVASLEEKLVGATDFERERETEFIKVRKLKKVVEKFQTHLADAKAEIMDLKARLLESSNIRATALEQERVVHDLTAQMDKLEHIREKQSRKIVELKNEVDVTSQSMEEKKAVASNTVHALSSELRTTKKALDEITRRERQLLDLRAVIARMLGMDIRTLAVPDYEIISRLEQLILANQSNAFATISLDNALEDADEAFRTGYHTARAEKQIITPMVRTRSPTRLSRTRGRSRSVSPTRKRDTRAY